MKLTVNKNQLNESIQQVSKAISSRTAIPILSGIKIEAHSQSITLTASDTDISIQSTIPPQQGDVELFTLEQEGAVVLPAKFFVDIIRKLPEDFVEIEVKDGFQTMIRSGLSEIQLVGMDAEEYPVLPSLDAKEIVMMQSDLLKTMIRQTILAVSTHESTPILTGVLFTIQEEQIKLTATDRHRLATREASIRNDDAIQFRNIVISGKNLNELQKLLPDQDTLIEVVRADNQVLFNLGQVLFYTRILDGIYPDTSKIIPQTYKTEIVVPAKLFLNAMDRVNLLSREERTNIVKMATLDDGKIEISSSSSELGRITEQLDAQSISGEPLRISFNSRYMLDALKTIDSEWIHLGFTGAMSPIIVKPKDETFLLHLILPYRTTG